MKCVDSLRSDADNIAQAAMPCSGAPDYKAVRRILFKHCDEIDGVVGGVMSSTVDIVRNYDTMRNLVREMLPFVGETCPDTCKYREECDSDKNMGSDGYPLMCVAYSHYHEAVRNLGIEEIEGGD